MVTAALAVTSVIVEEVDTGHLAQKLPPMGAGRWALYADVVNRDGLAETAVAEIDLPEIAGTPLAGDDSTGEVPPAGPDRIVRVGNEPLRARVPARLSFLVEDENGRPASDMELYMGMLGHAAVLKRDRTIFAHLHPSGSVPMAALQVASGDAHAGHAMAPGKLPAAVSFPYGFPRAGDYRVFVQVKRGGQVRSGAFDLTVTE